MHELQLAGELLAAVRESLLKYDNIESVAEVEIVIGRLSFAGAEQIRFCWKTLTEDDDLLRGAELKIGSEDGMIRCRECSYEGELSVAEDPNFHYFLPVFACPKCHGSVDIIKGNAVSVTNVKLIIADGGGSD
ncbi:MAG: hydrogenase maturation nickel metallochaperone HypA [Thermoplasmatota archaeon]